MGYKDSVVLVPWPSDWAPSVTSPVPERTTSMTKPKKDYRQTNLVVSGRSAFPLDMLRYDMCVPRGSEDVSTIEHSQDFANRRDANGFPRDFVVRLLRYSGAGSKCTADRWRSFGWVVIEDEGEDR